MNEFEKIRAWNALKTQINKIYDYKTRQTYHKAFLAKAIDSYGFNPENPAYGQKNDTSVDLDDWEQEFVEDVNDTVVFGIDVRKEKRKKEFDLMRKNMREFVHNGGSFTDIPKDILTAEIFNVYIEELLREGDNLIELANSVLNKGENK